MAIKVPSTFAQESIYIYSRDPALDTEHPDFDFDAWVDTGDRKFIPLKPGQEATEFTLRRLDGKTYQELAGYFLSAEDDPYRVRNRAFGLDLCLRHGVITASNFPRLVRVDDRTGRQVLSEESAALIYAVDNTGLAHELIARIMFLSRGELPGKR